MNVVIYDGPVDPESVNTPLFDAVATFCRVCKYRQERLLSSLIESILNEPDQGRYETVMSMIFQVNSELRAQSEIQVSPHIEDGAYTACLVMQLSNPSWKVSMDLMGYLEFKHGSGDLHVCLSVDFLIPVNPCTVLESAVPTPRYSYRRAAWKHVRSIWSKIV